MVEEVATSVAALAKQVYSLDDCSSHTTEKSCWLVIHGKVYDVTEFLDEHPGGYDIVVASSGKDATEDFEEIGHSNAAQEMLEKYMIGDFAGGDSSTVKATKSALLITSSGKSSPAAALFKALLPLIVLAAAIALAMSLKA